MLTKKQIESLKPKAGIKITKVRVAQNLYIHIREHGRKFWWFRYFSEGKEKGISLGSFPCVGVKEASIKAMELKALHARGVDLSQNKKAHKATSSDGGSDCFELVAREWFAVRMANKSEVHKKRVIVSLEKDIFPYLGELSVSEITASQLLKALRKVEDRGAIETAHRIKGRCSAVFCYAIATGRAQNDPTAFLGQALRPVVPTHLPAITNPVKVGELLSVIDGYQSSLIVSCALRFAPLVFVRPGELRHAELQDFDFLKSEWRLKISKTMNSGVAEHIVPLSRQALTILQEIEPVTGESKYVFPSATSITRPMSNNAILAAFRRMGIPKEEMCGHGWRATARTLIEEELDYPPHIIEQQLAHVVRDPLGRAYNRTTHLKQRKIMMQDWADYLDSLRDSTKNLR